MAASRSARPLPQAPPAGPSTSTLLPSTATTSSDPVPSSSTLPSPSTSTPPITTGPRSGTASPPPAPATSLVTASTAATASGEPIVCNGCKLGLEETGDSVVVSFGSSLWHVDCRCAKCHNLVEHDTNLLLLSDGSPVCENCSYICSVCLKPISNEAIVTGDESYHADCFRCRSCANKIEELIFAKTSQGIWCMACHNERVARSRKHAEAKRNRSARKEREAAARAPKSSRSAGLAVVPLTPASDTFSLGGANGASTAPSTPAVPESGGSTPRPGPPPSPFPVPGSSPDPPPAPTSSNHLALHTHPFPRAPAVRPKTSPSPSRARRPPDLPGSFSTQSLSSLAAPPPPATATSLSSSSSSWGDMERTTSQTSLATDLDETAVIALVSSPSTTLVVPGSAAAVADDDASSSEKDGSSLAPSSLPTSRQGSLSAPHTDRSANRRSGFYGLFGRPSPEDDTAATVAAEGPVEELGPSAATATTKSDDDKSEPLGIYGKDTSAASSPSASSSSVSEIPSFLPELHHSMSFYDPDTLLFLDHVASSSGADSPPIAKPFLNGAGTGAASAGLTPAITTVTGSIADVPAEQVEHLSPDLGSSSGGGGGGGGGVGTSSADEEGEDTSALPAKERNPKSEVARKVRESIRRSRESEGSAAAMNLDVELVEMLLLELEGTKKEMQDLQAKYNAFRRASRSAFEGFSMAREEYDKEVAARREVESKMDDLRVKFTEQALKLAAVDKEHRTAEALKRRSRELRVSVVGMEKQLSQLKAEMELSTAQMEELSLKSFSDDGSNATTPTSSEIEKSLTVRLEGVKATHRREIENLIHERDELAREIAELRLTRDRFAEESAALSLQNSSLAVKNSEAKRQLDEAREAVTKLRNPALGAVQENQLAHHRTGSAPAGPPARAPHSSSSRSAATSTPPPTDPDVTLDLTHRIAKPETIESHAPATAKKFKWGKASKQHESARPTHVAAASSTSSKAFLTPRTHGSTDLTGRTHAFQQTSILRPIRCEYCGDKMWGLNEVRCTACGCYSHAKCAGYLHVCGIPSAHTQDDTLNFTQNGPTMFGNDLTAQAKLEDRQIPLVVTKCIAAVEAFGMNYEGIYRKTGGMGQTRLITQCFERGQEFDLEDLDKFNDLAAVTSCMKNFFRSLPDPLFTHDLHERFVSCAELPDGEGRLVALEEALYQLPEAHFNTARMLIGHLHRVHLSSSENKMTPANLGVVFGPTLLRSRLASREFSDMGFKAKLVELLVEQHPRLFAKPYTQPPEENGA